jgi:mannosyltransferase OCH1-like enzyme
VVPLDDLIQTKQHRDGQPNNSTHQQESPTCQPTIPRIIHQTAKDPSNLPPLWAAFQASWKANHPTWEYKIWTDEENLNLCKERFPWFLETYVSLPKTIMRVDAVRYMYMYAYGGVYTDLDAESLRPLDGLLAGRAAVLAAMGSDLDTFEHSIPNAFMASVPGHPIWVHLLRAVKEAAGQINSDTGVETVAGEST